MFHPCCFTVFLNPTQHLAGKKYNVLACSYPKTCKKGLLLEFCVQALLATKQFFHVFPIGSEVLRL